MKPSKSAVLPRNAQKNTFSMSAKSAKNTRGRKMYQKNIPCCAPLFAWPGFYLGFLFGGEVDPKNFWSHAAVKKFLGLLGGPGPCSPGKRLKK